MIADFVLLIWAYGSTVVHLVAPTRWAWTSVKLQCKGNARQRLPSWVDRTLVLLWHFLSSTFFEMLFQMAWFGIGVRNLIVDWQWGQYILQNPSLYY